MMRVAEPGHVYEVVNADGSGTQTITFVRRRGSDARPHPDAARRRLQDPDPHPAREAER